MRGLLLLVLTTALVGWAAAKPAGFRPAAHAAMKRGDDDIPGATYLEPALVDKDNLALTFTEHLLLVKSSSCASQCSQLESKIPSCNATAVSDNDLSSCLCGAIDLAYDCAICVANGTQSGRADLQSESIRDAAAIVLYQDLFHACAAGKLIRPIATETITILASPPIPAKSFAASVTGPGGEHTLAMPPAASSSASNGSDVGPTAGYNGTGFNGTASAGHTFTAPVQGMLIGPLTLLMYALTW